MKLYLVRHAEAEGNGEGRYIGWEDVPLTAAGLRQAEALASRLSAAPLSRIQCSDLRRAVATARAIARPHGLAPEPLAALREANFGDWSGLTYAEIARSAPERLHRWLADPERTAPPRGESVAALRARALAALPRQDGALVVTHGGTLRAVLAHLLGRGFWDVAVPLAGLTVLEWDGVRATMLEQG